MKLQNMGLVIKSILECIDYPFELNQNNQELEVQVCSGHGVC